MFYSTDCNYIIKVNNELVIIECYTKEQVMANIRHKNGCAVYKVLKDGKNELIGKIIPYNVL